MPHVGTSKMKIEPLLVTIQHTSHLIGRCNATVYGLIGAGRLEAVKSDGRTLVKMDSIKAYVDDLPKATIAATAQAHADAPAPPSGDRDLMR